MASVSVSSGRAPFVGEHVAAVLIKVLLEDAPPVETIRPGLPPALSDLLKRMLRKDPRERFPHGQALHEALRRLELPPDAEERLLSPTLLAVAAVETLTPQEQQIFSVAVAIPTTDEAALATLTPQESGERYTVQRSVQEKLRQMGASVELLGDGSLVATILPSASVSDQALLAARCGLLLKERLPSAEVAVATGRGMLRGLIPIGEAVDRALQRLKRNTPNTGGPDPAQPGEEVFLDALCENLLSPRFTIVRHGGRACLGREMNPATGEDVRRLLGQPTPCVGREQDLASLEAALATAIADSVARAVGVVAPPGIGKSRLRQAFLRSASQRHPDLRILLGRGDMMSTGAPYGMLGQVLCRHYGLIGGESLSVQQGRLRERLGSHLKQESTERVIHFLGEICGVHFPSEGDPALRAARSDPKVMHDQIMQAFLEWLHNECEAAPMLLVLEDLHWGDALTVQLMEQALRELAELPLSILALGRPEVQALFPSFWSTRWLQELPLRALSRRACERLAQDVLRRSMGNTVDSATVARIVA